jgi:hypothetical protein
MDFTGVLKKTLAEEHLPVYNNHIQEDLFE